VKWMYGDSKGYDTGARRGTALGLLTRVDILVLWSRVIITIMQFTICVSLILQYSLDQKVLSGW